MVQNRKFMGRKVSSGSKKTNHSNFKPKHSRIIRSTKNELNERNEFFKLFKNSTIPKDEILDNLGLFINRQNLSNIIFMNEMYKKIINIPGAVMEFGVRWGQNLSLFESFRGMYEPFNYNRKIIGFDTFAGFPSISSKDSKLHNIKKGAYSLTKKYKNYLEKVLDYHENESPISHIKKYELVEGDAIVTLKKYLRQNPHTIIALAWFDFDIYKPTKKCLELIQPHLIKGSVIGFDQLNYDVFKGETIALKETLDISNLKLQRSPNSNHSSYFVME